LVLNGREYLAVSGTLMPLKKEKGLYLGKPMGKDPERERILEKSQKKRGARGKERKDRWI